MKRKIVEKGSACKRRLEEYYLAAIKSMKEAIKVVKCRIGLKHDGRGARMSERSSITFRQAACIDVGEILNILALLSPILLRGDKQSIERNYRSVVATRP